MCERILEEAAFPTCGGPDGTYRRTLPSIITPAGEPIELLHLQTTYVRNPKVSILPQTTLSPHSNLHHQDNPEELQSLHCFSLECSVLTAPRVYGPSHNYVTEDKT